jgi:hypothetical protein
MSLTQSQIQDRIYGEIVSGGMSIDGTDYSFSSIEAVKSWVAQNGDIPQDAYINFRNLTYTEVQLLYSGLSKPNLPPQVAATTIVNGKLVETNPPKTLNIKDSPSAGDPTITILASGNADKYPTGLKKSNDQRDHVCNMPLYVKRALNYAGFMGGTLIVEIRKTIKALLVALGVNPSGSGFINRLKKIAQDIKDLAKQLKIIQKGIDAFITFVAKIKQLIAYILSLPQKLIIFFKDCLNQAYKELQSGYLDAVAAATGTDKSDSLLSTATDLVKSTNSLISEAQKTVGRTVAAVESVVNVTGGVTPTNKDLDTITTEIQTAYNDLGYGANSKENYGKP